MGYGYRCYKCNSDKCKKKKEETETNKNVRNVPRRDNNKIDFLFSFSSLIGIFKAASPNIPYSLFILQYHANYPPRVLPALMDFYTLKVVTELSVIPQRHYINVHIANG